MGALDEFLSGTAETDVSQPKTSVITDDLLDRLRKVESGKDKFAVNKQTKAMGPYQFLPETVQMLHKQGYEFSPFNEEQARSAARYYLEQLVKQNKGDVNKAVAQYGGHITADPTKYVNAVVGQPNQEKTVPAVSTLDEFLSGGAEPEQGPPISVEVSGGVAQEPVTEQLNQQFTGARTRAGVPVKDTSDVLTGALGGLARTVGGAARGFGTAALGLPGDINKLIVENVGSAFPNAPALPTTKELQQTLPFQPESQEGKIAQQLGEFLPAPPAAKVLSKVPGAKAAMETAFAEKVAPVAQRVEPTMQPTVPRTTMAGKVEPTMTAANQPQMAGVGAAARTNEAALQQALTQASPELRQELTKLKPEEVNVPVLERHLDADSLPVPVRLTKGQALQDPVLISRERNERGLKEQYANFLNQQNKDLQESANLMKERVAPDVNTTSFVEDAENAIDLMNKRIKADDDKISEAYNALKDYGAGKLRVDSEIFANDAKKVLSENDDIDFLPDVFVKKLDAYANGKPMNFNQFEHLRSQLAKAIRSSDDGNVTYALSLVRSELEKMPLLNETSEAKVLADKARSLAKAQFDLLDKKRPTYNPLYAEVMNGIADTKDFIPKLVFRSKNKEFAKTLETLQDDPQALQHLRSGAMDYIIRESTDASGNFLTGKFNKLINNLDVNKKLDSLFGEEAKTLRAIANTGKLVEARPKGSFVNESNTATAAAQMAKQYGAELAKRTPVVGALVEPATQILQARKAAKEVKETLKPGAGIKIKDIGKKK